MADSQSPDISKKLKSEIRHQITQQLETLKVSRLMRWLTLMVFMAVAMIAPSLLLLILLDMTILLYILLVIVSVAGGMQVWSVIHNSYVRKKFLRAANAFNEVYADGTDERIFATRHLVDVANVEDYPYRDEACGLLEAVGEPFWSLGIFAPADHSRREMQQQLHVCLSVYKAKIGFVLPILTIPVSVFCATYALMEYFFPVTLAIVSIALVALTFPIAVGVAFIALTAYTASQDSRAVKSFENAFAVGSPERTFAAEVIQIAQNGNNPELKGMAEDLGAALGKNLFPPANKKSKVKSTAIVQKELQNGHGTDIPLQTDTAPADKPDRMEESSRSSYSQRRQIVLEPEDSEDIKPDTE